MARPQLPRTGVIGFLFLAGSAALWYACFRPDTPPTTLATQDELPAYTVPPDPRLTSDSIFRNIKPDVRYVGDARCETCHGIICKSYHAHPMGMSASSVRGATPIEKYDAAARNPLKSDIYELRVTKTPAGASHTISAKDSGGKPLPDYVIATDLAIGSGTRGRTYLSVENGTVWQSPLSWFSETAHWDHFPAFDLATGGRREINTDCLLCHVDRVEPIPRTTNRFREPLFPIQTAIGCERCHGPGELHVRERADLKPTAKVDTSIVNPKHLSSPLRASICAQCHLQGEERVARRGRDVTEFRPGLNFEEFVRVFVRHPDLSDPAKSVGQFEQVALSHCKTKTGESLSCTNCHDPHLAPGPAEKDKFYRDQCLKCHETKGCKAPLAERQSKADSCMACHMPKAESTNIGHTSVTDHRVIRRKAPSPPSKGLQPGSSPLVPFHVGPFAADPESDRDLGIALSRLVAKLPPGSPLQQLVAQQARDHLDLSAASWRGDADTWLAMSRSRMGTFQAKERLEDAERAARLEPDSEAVLAAVADAANAAGKHDRAEEAATKAIAMNPKSVEHLLARAAAYTGRKQWDKAEEDCRAALRIQPLFPAAHLGLSVSLYSRGDRDAGLKELETAVGLSMEPQRKAAFREWFLKQTR